MSMPLSAVPRSAISTSNHTPPTILPMSITDLISGRDADDEAQTNQGDSTDGDQEAAAGAAGLSDRELKQRIGTANTEFEQAEKKRTAYQEKIQELLKAGSQSENQKERRYIAMRIRQMKQRAAVMDLKQQSSLRDLFKYTLENEVQDIQEMLHDELNRESPMDEFDVSSGEFTEQFDQIAASVHSEITEMNDVLKDLSTSVEGAESTIVNDALPEEEQMDRIAEDELDAEEVELNIDPDGDSEGSGEFLESDAFDGAAEDLCDDSEEDGLAASLAK